MRKYIQISIMIVSTLSLNVLTAATPSPLLAPFSMLNYGHFGAISNKSDATLTIKDAAGKTLATIQPNSILSFNTNNSVLKDPNPLGFYAQPTDLAGVSKITIDADKHDWHIDLVIVELTHSIIATSQLVPQSTGLHTITASQVFTLSPLFQQFYQLLSERKGQVMEDSLLYKNYVAPWNQAFANKAATLYNQLVSGGNITNVKDKPTFMDRFHVYMNTLLKDGLSIFITCEYRNKKGEIAPTVNATFDHLAINPFGYTAQEINPSKPKVTLPKDPGIASKLQNELVDKLSALPSVLIDLRKPEAQQAGLVTPVFTPPGIAEYLSATLKDIE